MTSPAIFLDRDGVINKDYGYVYQIKDFDFIDGIFNFVKKAQSLGYKIVIITNQAGIARGLYTERDFHTLTDWMLKEFVKSGCKVDKVYYCPFHPTEGLGKYLKDDLSRKPNPGMIIKAQNELDIDLSNSILIGDKSSDINAGLASGVGTNILLSNKDLHDLAKKDHQRITYINEAMTFLKYTNIYEE
jgi:D-glycero-D-manno-heptose 1,7-bisphosphate phosphatase|tara:strand:- start:17359 stop:17922 length:564 start_codon:yes stop_codon:yes gene_type:complete